MRTLLPVLVFFLTSLVAAVPAQRIAALPERVKGYGHVKEQARKRWLEEESRLLAEFHQPPAPVALFDPNRKSAA